MRQLVVFAHPNPKSFCKAMVDVIEKVSQEKNIEIEIRDLYKIGFDPILKPADFETFSKGSVPDDIKTEQDYISKADIITVVYPVWWTGVPAMLKGYIDRVFTNGFAYRYESGNPVGLLKNKRVLLFSTTGTTNEIYTETGMHASMKMTTDEGIFRFSGMEVIDHVFFGAVPFVSDEGRKEYLFEVENVIREKL